MICSFDPFCLAMEWRWWAPVGPQALMPSPSEITLSGLWLRWGCGCAQPWLVKTCLELKADRLSVFLSQSQGISRLEDQYRFIIYGGGRGGIWGWKPWQLCVRSRAGISSTPQGSHPPSGLLELCTSTTRCFTKIHLISSHDLKSE